MYRYSCGGLGLDYNPSIMTERIYRENIQREYTERIYRENIQREYTERIYYVHSD